MLNSPGGYSDSAAVGIASGSRYYGKELLQETRDSNFVSLKYSPSGRLMKRELLVGDYPRQESQRAKDFNAFENR